LEKDYCSIPIYKKREKDIVSNYRGISLLCLAYKIYTKVLRNRLEKETEEKNLILESQADFRKGKSTLNVFVLNHIMQREIRDEEKGGKFYVFCRFKDCF